MSQGAAGGPAEGPAAGAEGGGARGEECSHSGRQRAAGQSHGGKHQSNFQPGNGLKMCDSECTLIIMGGF